jgi:UDP-N-acetylglucosamine acyltransferase
MFDFKAFLPQKYPYIWVDKILDYDPNSRIVALKNVSHNEPVFQGHFPDNPIFPNGLIVEALAQAASLIFLRDPEFAGRLAQLTSIQKVEFLNPVVPGDQLRLEVDVLKIKSDEIRLSGHALVDGKTVCLAEFCLKLALPQSRPHIHPTASVHASAILGRDVSVGPFSIIGENVVIGDRTVIGAHVMIDRWTKIGQDCHIHFGSVIGSDAQDTKYNGEKSWVVLGDRNELREYVTINRATGKDAITEIGSDNILLTHVHLAHNCKLGNHITIANMTNVAGHTHIEDYATIGGMTGIHQFVRIGKGSMVGAYTRLPQDVAPFMLCEGNPAYIRGMNAVGLKRRGFSRQAISEIKSIYKAVFRSEKNLSQALSDVAQLEISSPEAFYLLDFIKVDSPRGLTKKKMNGSNEDSSDE